MKACLDKALLNVFSSTIQKSTNLSPTSLELAALVTMEYHERMRETREEYLAITKPFREYLTSSLVIVDGENSCGL